VGQFVTTHLPHSRQWFKLNINLQENLANAKVSARQHCVNEGPYERNVRQINARNISCLLPDTVAVHSVGFNAVTDNTVYLHSFSSCCLRNVRNPAKFSENSNI